MVWLSIASLTEAIILRGSTRVRIKLQVDVMCRDTSLLTIEFLMTNAGTPLL